MRFIRAIRIKNFRSLPAAEIAPVDDITPIVGPNGSGKSNLLRALNLFFNGAVEAGVPLDLGRDFHDPEKRRQDKKQIDVELDLHFGDGLRAELQAPLDRFASGMQIVTIRKRWVLDRTTREPSLELAIGPVGGALQVVDASERALAEPLLRSIRFRYLSNHVHPTDLLRQEEENIRRSLFRRLGKSPSFSADQIEKIREAAKALMGPVSRELDTATGRSSTVELGTPDDWGELLWVFGLKMQFGTAGAREAVLHGSGIQSALAYSVLHMLDTGLGGEFGWRRGAIWAIEEPESFLHADLQASLAESLSRYSQSERLQILLTTHNAGFLGVADSGVVVGMPGINSEVAVKQRVELVDLAATGGVARYAHPLHIGTIKPLLLMEGCTDCELIIRAFQASGTPCPYDIKAIEDLEPSLTGGVEQIQTYLGANRSALRARPSSSPVVVLLDWEVPEGKRDKIQRALSEHPSSTCQLMPAEAKTPSLKPDMPGIEAYLSLEFFRDAAAEIGLTIVHPGDPKTAGWELGVDKAELGQRKADIHRFLLARDRATDLTSLTKLVPWIVELSAKRLDKV